MMNFESVDLAQEQRKSNVTLLCGLCAPVGTVATCWASSQCAAATGIAATLWWVLALAFLFVSAIMPIWRIDWVDTPRRCRNYLFLLGLSIVFMAMHLVMMSVDPARVSNRVYLVALFIAVFFAVSTVPFAAGGGRYETDWRFIPEFMENIACYRRSEDIIERRVSKNELEGEFTRVAVRIMGEVQWIFFLCLATRFSSTIESPVRFFLTLALIICIITVRGRVMKRADQRLADLIRKEMEAASPEAEHGE